MKRVIPLMVLLIQLFITGWVGLFLWTINTWPLDDSHLGDPEGINWATLSIKIAFRGALFAVFFSFVVYAVDYVARKFSVFEPIIRKSAVWTFLIVMCINLLSSSLFYFQKPLF